MTTVPEPAGRPGIERPIDLQDLPAHEKPESVPAPGHRPDEEEPDPASPFRPDATR
ncbi:hypothetical protein ACTOB_005278 [Actinoplanes oblitus]|uniref:Uncharacterized protein n=1 Tax=Actinoplanes oblitus TaxID=3040509 RepID=A0ABY8W8D1_9ACTN|nr:hypothetical protein [Actinoplanes oblitus]WIM93303.1 hypothetical protein ACTOB_005278 [Actinoplanes oblitus]